MSNPCWVCSRELPEIGPQGGRPAQYCNAACRQAAKNAKRVARRQEWRQSQAAIRERLRSDFRATYGEHLDEAA
jgi:hypothetical protein